MTFLFASANLDLADQYIESVDDFNGHYISEWDYSVVTRNIRSIYGTKVQ